MGKRGRLDLAYGFRQKARKHHRCRKKTVGRYLERRIPVCIEPLDHVVRTDGKGGPEHPEYPGVDRNAPVPQHQDEHPEERKPQRNPRKPRQTLPEYDGRHQRRNDGRGSNEDASRGRRQRLGTFIEDEQIDGKPKRARKREPGQLAPVKHPHALAAQHGIEHHGRDGATQEPERG